MKISLALKVWILTTDTPGVGLIHPIVRGRRKLPQSQVQARQKSRGRQSPNYPIRLLQRKLHKRPPSRPARLPFADSAKPRLPSSQILDPHFAGRKQWISNCQQWEPHLLLEEGTMPSRNANGNICGRKMPSFVSQILQRITLLSKWNSEPCTRPVPDKQCRENKSYLFIKCS